ncbi:hypothetical protein, partial [Streptomyces sp. NPDC057909]|uniref:hypothetical protein n=1 Tax=Streptomyces sp. NPDC057909 TaxID=3346277 RepID=UPI0036EC304F
STQNDNFGTRTCLPATPCVTGETGTDETGTSEITWGQNELTDTLTGQLRNWWDAPSTGDMTNSDSGQGGAPATSHYTNGNSITFPLTLIATGYTALPAATAPLEGLNAAGNMLSRGPALLDVNPIMIDLDELAGMPGNVTVYATGDGSAAVCRRCGNLVTWDTATTGVAGEQAILDLALSSSPGTPIVVGTGVDGLPNGSVAVGAKGRLFMMTDTMLAEDISVETGNPITIYDVANRVQAQDFAEIASQARTSAPGSQIVVANWCYSSFACE